MVAWLAAIPAALNLVKGITGGSAKQSTAQNGSNNLGALLSSEKQSDGKTIAIFAPKEQQVASKASSSGGGDNIVGNLLGGVGNLVGGLLGGGDKKGGGLLGGILG